MGYAVTRWTPAEVRELKRLARGKTLFRREIAEKMGKPLHAVSYMMRKCGIKYRVPGRYGEWNITMKPLREPVMRYFQTHTVDETAEHFGIKPGQVRGIVSVCYKDPAYRHLRKDSRTKRPFKHDDWIFLAAHAGIMPRGWIAKKLGRSKLGRFHVVKERLRGAGASSRYLNGLTLSLAKTLLPELAFLPIKTKAGSQGCNGHTQANIVPWVMLEDLTRSRRIDPTVRAGIRAMARFQRYIHGAQSNGEALNSILSILHGGRYAKRTAKAA